MVVFLGRQDTYVFVSITMISNRQNNGYIHVQLGQSMSLSGLFTGVNEGDPSTGKLPVGSKFDKNHILTGFQVLSFIESGREVRVAAL